MAFAARKMIGIVFIFLLAVIITNNSYFCIVFAQIYTNGTLNSAAPHVVPSPHGLNNATNITAGHLKGPSTVIASPVTNEMEGNASINNITTAGSSVLH